MDRNKKRTAPHRTTQDPTHYPAAEITQPLPQPVTAINPAAAADLLGLRPQTLANMRLRGDGPPYIKGPGKNGFVRYIVADLIAWRERLKLRSTSDRSDRDA